MGRKLKEMVDGLVIGGILIVVSGAKSNEIVKRDGVHGAVAGAFRVALSAE
jgi:hypothetical protein